MPRREQVSLVTPYERRVSRTHQRFRIRSRDSTVQRATTLRVGAASTAWTKFLSSRSRQRPSSIRRPHPTRLLILDISEEEALAKLVSHPQSLFVYRFF